MFRNENTTVPDTFVGANEEQSQAINTTSSIADIDSADKQNFSQESEPPRGHCSVNDLVTHSLTEILDTTFQPQIPLIDGMLYEGTYLFAGSPKVGKSFMMAQIAFHVSTGTEMWGMKVHKSTVLYLALEDTYARIQKRLSRMFHMEDSEMLHFAIHSKMIQNGLDEQLVQFIAEHPDTKLIIIDTLQKVRELSNDSNMYSGDYEVVSRVKRIADQFHLCVMFVHHTRKKKAPDIFEEISGSQGLMGAADGAFIMKKKRRTSNQASIDISGRDQPDTTINVVRDEERCYWELQNMDTELWKEPDDPLVGKVAALLSKEQPEWNGTASELLEAIGETEVAANVLTRRLNTKVDTFLQKYGICYSTSHKHKERSIHLALKVE